MYIIMWVHVHKNILCPCTCMSYMLSCMSCACHVQVVDELCQRLMAMEYVDSTHEDMLCALQGWCVGGDISHETQHKIETIKVPPAQGVNAAEGQGSQHYCSLRWKSIPVYIGNCCTLNPAPPLYCIFFHLSSPTSRYSN